MTETAKTHEWKNSRPSDSPLRDPLLPQDERLKKKTFVHHHLSETSKPPHLSHQVHSGLR